VQTGVARTGRWWCCQHHGIRPDIITTAKGIAGGVPLGAMLARESVAQALQPGTHASTFGANPLATRAGLEVMRVIREEGLLARVTELGAHLGNGLKALISKFEGLAVAVRGRGLVQGLELATAEDAKRALAAATDKGLLLNAVQGKTLRFVPALVASKAELDEALDLTAASLAALAGS
jgi:acetylornithine/succinyldiaminopimelate/putrescine aminotransferase